MKHFFLICCLFCGFSAAMQAQGVVWGAPVANTPQVTIDTAGGLKLHWTNRLGTNNNGFSPPRFFHVWVEQLQNGVWIVPPAAQHFFVSDTAWVAESGMNLGSPNTPTRFRIAPYHATPLRMASGAAQKTTVMPALQEDPQKAITSSTIPSTNNTVQYCCVITIIVDTRPLPIVTTPTLNTAAANPNLIPVTGSVSSFNNIDAFIASNYNGKELAIKVKQQTATGITDILYINSNTLSVLKVGAATTNRIILENNLRQLLSIVKERLASASYNNFSTSPVRIEVQ